MSLNSAMVYRRTDRGLREVYEKSHQFTQSERLVLILLDGRLTVAGLRARLPSLDSDRIERTLEKLESAGLVEPSGSVDAAVAASPAEEVSRLEPEVVAQFLEQSQFDPVTAAATTDEEVSAQRVRSSVEQAAAQLAREGAAQTARPALREPPTLGAPEDESGRPHSLIETAEDEDWVNTEATRFAITTVNVPDRLDLQEELDRAEMAEYAQERRAVGSRSWMKVVLVVAVVGVVAFVIFGVLKPLRDDASAARVADRLSLAFKRPVTIAETEFRVRPSPRLVVRGIDVGGEFTVSEVVLLINWKDLWSALNGGPWAWGEAIVPPLTMPASHAAAALKALPAGAAGLPARISALRFDSVSVSGSRLFPGRYEAVLRRADDGAFGPLILKQLDAEGGVMQIQFRAAQGASEPGAIDFSLEAQRWALPVGPRARWSDVRATGRISTDRLEVSSYSLNGFFGVATGTAVAARDAEWVISGTAEAANIDVETVLNSLRPGELASREGRATPMQGTATLNLLLAGRGATLDEALTRSAVAGPFSVRGAVLNGINLGLAATQGAGASGSTRFTEFGGTMAASGNIVRFEETGGRAGAMTVRANFTVAPDLSMAGVVRVDLGGGRRVQAPLSLRLSGTPLEPRFGR